jgi:nicotinamidase/pyrazinamidase
MFHFTEYRRNKMVNQKRSALIIIDVQNDFCPGGALEVRDGDRVIPVINRLSHLFSIIVATQDWHPANHKSFASQHAGKKPLDVIKLGETEQVLWPNHCVQGTGGADFHPGLNIKPVKLIVRKGMNPEIDSYSGFFENDRETPTGLEFYLKGFGIMDVYLGGLATDYCAYYTAKDALKLGFKTYLVSDACRGVDFPENNVDNAINDLKAKGAFIIVSNELLKQE